MFKKDKPKVEPPAPKEKPAPASNEAPAPATTPAGKTPVLPVLPVKGA